MDTSERVEVSGLLECAAAVIGLAQNTVADAARYIARHLAGEGRTDVGDAEGCELARELGRLGGVAAEVGEILATRN